MLLLTFINRAMGQRRHNIVLGKLEIVQGQTSCPLLSMNMHKRSAFTNNSCIDVTTKKYMCFYKHEVY